MFKPSQPYHTLISPNTSGIRSLGAIKGVVTHCTDDLGSAANVCAYFHSPDTASTHLIVDNKETWRAAWDRDICWGATSNGHNINELWLHIELCGLEAWSREEWLTKHKKTIQRGAWWTAHWCHKYDLRTKWCSPAALKDGEGGITSHRNVSAAWVPGGHSDPGPMDGHHFPYDKYMYWIHKYHKGM